MTTHTLERQLAAGQRVRFAGDRRFWQVRAADDRFAVLTRHADFQPAGVVVYTIADQHEGVRGPCNLIGQGWDFNPDSLDHDAQRLLRALQYQLEVWARLEAGEKQVAIEDHAVEISHRNRVALDVEEVR